MDHAVVVRKVWKGNLVDEFDLIKVALMSYRMVSIDIEFPGIVYRPANVDKNEFGKFPPIWNYQVIRDNVNSTNIIQLGLALCDDKGSLPHFGTGCQCVWDFNFNNFDAYNDLQRTRNRSSYLSAKESILTKEGIEN